MKMYVVLFCELTCNFQHHPLADGWGDVVACDAQVGTSILASHFGKGDGGLDCKRLKNLNECMKLFFVKAQIFCF